MDARRFDHSRARHPVLRNGLPSPAAIVTNGGEAPPDLVLEGGAID